MNTEQPVRKRRKWLKWTGIGCGAYLLLCLILGLLGFLPDTPPAATGATPPAFDSIPARSEVHYFDTTAAKPDTTPHKASTKVQQPVIPLPIDPPAAKESVQPKKATKEVVVYITRTGDHYHRSSCSSLRKSKIKSTLTEVRNMGYEACRRCHPAN